MKLALLIALVAGPVLGSPSYMGEYGVGWGTAAPPEISNGGTPNGSVDRITWTDWSGPVARGTGRTYIYRPIGGYYPGSVRAQLRVSNLGTCPNRSERAYRTLLARSPSWPGGPLGGWHRWSNSRTICDADAQARSSYCKNLGRYDAHGSAQALDAYRVSCATARRAATGMRDAHCPTSGCTRTVAGLRCTLDRLHREDYVIGEARGKPRHRLTCRRGSAVLTAFLLR